MKNLTEEFYDKIAQKYQWFLSSWDNIMDRQLKMLIPVLNENNVKTILDCACGTGLQTIGLKKSGYQIIGSDLSTGMLEKANQNANEENLKIQFVKSDFRELSKKIPEKFDAVICLGNAISHLMNNKDLSDALGNIYEKVNDNGIAIFEMRDFDAMLKDKNRFQPMRINDVKDNKSVSVFFVYDYLEKSIMFNVIYLIHDLLSGEKLMEVESVEYNAVLKENFIKLLMDSKFKDVKIDENGYYIAHR